MVNGLEFLQWYYLIYLLPGGLALISLLLSVAGGGMHHTHTGLGHGHHSLGHHSPGHSSPAHTAQGSRGTSPLISPLTFLGLGRVPAPLVWGSGFLGWGIFGFWGTQFWQSHLPLSFVLPAFATAFFGAVLTEKATVEAAIRLLPQEETFAVESVDLCGLTGTVAFPVNPVRGRVHIYDAHGTMHDVPARTLPDSAGIMRGRTVLVTDYDAGRDQVIVEEML